jgi:hypothetical protein
VNKAQKVEQWARKEMYVQGLESTPATFDYLVKDIAKKLGLSDHVTKYTLLDNVYAQISKQPKRPDNRAKIKEITESLLEGAEKSKNHIRSIYKSREEKLKAELAEAHKLIKQKDRALKSAAPKTGK